MELEDYLDINALGKNKANDNFLKLLNEGWLMSTQQTKNILMNAALGQTLPSELDNAFDQIFKDGLESLEDERKHQELKDEAIAALERQKDIYDYEHSKGVKFG